MKYKREIETYLGFIEKSLKKINDDPYFYARIIKKDIKAIKTYLDHEKNEDRRKKK